MKAKNGAKVTVAKAEKDGLPLTVCKDNGEHDWSMKYDSQIIGIPQEKINA